MTWANGVKNFSFLDFASKIFKKILQGRICPAFLSLTAMMEKICLFQCVVHYESWSCEIMILAHMICSHMTEIRLRRTKFKFVFSNVFFDISLQYRIIGRSVLHNQCFQRHVKKSLRHLYHLIYIHARSVPLYRPILFAWWDSPDQLELFGHQIMTNGRRRINWRHFPCCVGTYTPLNACSHIHCVLSICIQFIWMLWIWGNRECVNRFWVSWQWYLVNGQGYLAYRFLW